MPIFFSTQSIKPQHSTTLPTLRWVPVYSLLFRLLPASPTPSILLFSFIFLIFRAVFCAFSVFSRVLYRAERVFSGSPSSLKMKTHLSVRRIVTLDQFESPYHFPPMKGYHPVQPCYDNRYLINNHHHRHSNNIRNSPYTLPKGFPCFEVFRYQSNSELQKYIPCNPIT